MLYGSDQQFTEYLFHLDEVFSESEDQFKSICSNMLTPEAVGMFFQHAKELLNAYVKMSPMFTDEAYKQSDNDKVLRRNLLSAQQAKEKYRLSINRFFLAGDSYLSRLVTKIATQRELEAAELWWHTTAELTKVFTNHGVNLKILNERRKAFVQIGDTTGISNYCGAEASALIKHFDRDAPLEKYSVSGVVASRGESPKTIGRVIVVNLDYENPHVVSRKMIEMQEGEILVSQTTSPELMLACRKASAIITDAGGLLSHAAIVSREFNIPCIVGTGDASKVFKDGDLVEVNTDSGTVQISLATEI
jgi:rifampicin phosphotransferase